MVGIKTSTDKRKQSHKHWKKDFYYDEDNCRLTTWMKCFSSYFAIALICKDEPEQTTLKIFLSGVACGAFENDVEALAM